MVKTSLSLDALQETLSRLRSANLAFAERAAAGPVGRQPVHTVYGGAHLFKADAARKLGLLAVRAMAEHAPDFAVFARALGLAGAAELPEDRAAIAALGEAVRTRPEAVRSASRAAWLAHAVHARVLDKLGREPVEDLRIDFEDGYGVRPAHEEDAHAEAAAREVVRGMAEGTLPPFLGIRIKSLTEECRDRALRTLDIFLTALATGSGGALPAGFVVTLPKVTVLEQIAALVDALEQLERALELPPLSLKLELMIETTASILGPRGEVALLPMIDAARGRCVSAHFGAYDYTASCDITAAHQRLDHPACDFARHAMQVALTRAGVRLSDGATNVLPVPPHRPGPDGAPLTAQQIEENRRAVHRAWRLQFEHVRRSLEHGFYQGWDLHPAQLPVRYAAVYAFFLEGLDAAAARLCNFIDRAAQATLVGTVFDDAATGQGLLAFFLRAIAAGAMTEDEAAATTTLTPAELRGRSFLAIVQNRRH